MSEIKREQLLMAIIAGRGPAFLRGLNLSSLDLSNAAWLEEADLRGADLSHANLRRANLSRANLEKANLHSANLLGAVMDEAVLQDVKANVADLNVARLRRANMRRISLVGASLIRADLEEADLEGADLEGANLEGCNFRKARLTNVNFKMANLHGADLTEAILDSAVGRPNRTDTPPGFHGTINSIRLTDLVQLACLARSDIDIEVSSASGKGNIYIGKGNVLHACAGDMTGEPALLKILTWDDGRFTTRPRTHDHLITIDKPVEHLMIQSLRLKDEKRHERRHSELVEHIRRYIPVTATVSEDLIGFLGIEGKKLEPAEKIEITDVFDSRENEEILCSVTARDDVFIAPLKYINLHTDHPLHGELATHFGVDK
ncbi:MAG: pentapeptide repeat-containing protein [Syntrophobacter sp.]